MFGVAVALSMMMMMMMVLFCVSLVVEAERDLRVSALEFECASLRRQSMQTAATSTAAPVTAPTASEEPACNAAVEPIFLASSLLILFE